MFGIPFSQQCRAEHISVCSHYSLEVKDSGTAAGGSRHSVQNRRKDELLHFSLHTLRTGVLLQSRRSCLLLGRELLYYKVSHLGISS